MSCSDSGIDLDNASATSSKNQGSSIRNYQSPSLVKLLQENDCNLIRNADLFTCFNCNICIGKNNGVILQNCGHDICEPCIKKVILNSKEPEIICPFNCKYVCNIPLQHREIRSLITTNQFEQFLHRSFLKGSNSESADYNFSKLVLLEDAQYIENTEKYNCAICLTEQIPKNGYVLRECLHVFCKICLTDYINNTLGCEISCPFKSDNGNNCDAFLQHREIQSLLNADEYQRFLKMSIQQAERMIGNTLHCVTPNCTDFTIVEAGDIEYECSVCHVVYCIPCKGSHVGMNCEQYKSRISAKKSEVEITELINAGQAMRCPKCAAVIMKIEGCDGMTCTFCKMDLCWATKGARWGPLGKGDNSGGCRCNLNNMKCARNCGNCH